MIGNELTVQEVTDNDLVGRVSEAAARPKPSEGTQVRYKARHVPELDGLRGIAVLVVLIHHMGWSFPDFEVRTFSDRLLHAWIAASRPGWVGVDIFFVLSGFLIAGILMDTKGRPHFYRNFYMKRVLRIFPLYYLILVVMLVFFGWPWRFFGLSVIFLSNVSEVFGVPMVMGPLWSLSVEEHFYLGLPWIIRFASRRAVLWVSLGICIAEPLFRSYALIAGFEAPYYTWFRLDGLAWGVIVAYLVRNHPPERVKKYGWLFCSTAILMVAVSAPFGGASHLKPVGVATLYACAALFVAGIVAGAAAGPGNRWFAVLRSRVLKFFGDISYCLYLVHILIILGFYRVATAMFHRPYLGGMFHNTALAYAVHFVIVFAVCTLIGVLSRDYFEGPIRSYRVNYQ